MAKNTKTNFLIPDTTRLAQYNPVFTVEDLTRSLSDKYRAFAQEIRNIIQTLLRQNSETQDQTNFRIANKFLLDERDVLNKFLNDDSFSPDLDILVATETENVIKEFGAKLNLTHTKVADVKTSLIKLFESQVSELTSYGKKVEQEMRTSLQKQGEELRKSMLATNAGTPKSVLSFTSFDGIKYYTGWITAQFTNTFRTAQTELFNSINRSVTDVQNLATSGIQNSIKQTIESVRPGESTITAPMTAQQRLAKRLNGLANVISTMTNRRELRWRTAHAISNGYHWVVNGFNGMIHGIGQQIKNLGLAMAQKTYDVAAKTLKKIGSMFKWSLERILSSSLTWGIAAWLLWKYWLKDRIGDTVTKWLGEFWNKVKGWLGFEGSFFDTTIGLLKTELYDKHIKKFVDWFNNTWGDRIDSVKEFLSTKINAVIDWAKKWIGKLKPVYDGAKKVVDWYMEGWNFIVEKVAKALKKPYDRLASGVKDLFRDMKETGEWIWNLITGKLNWKTAKTEFTEKIWNPAVVVFHDVMREISNFVIIHGNWVVDLLGIQNFTFGEAIDENGNPLGDPKTIFERIANGFGVWGKDSHTIKLADETSVIIKPSEQEQNGFSQGFDVKFIFPNKKLEATIPGMDNATKTLTELKETVDEFGTLAITTGGTLIGGFVGEWVGRIVGVLISVFAAIGTGGVSLAGIGHAWDIGGALGSILGSLIGYFFTRSLLNSRDYFDSPIRESISDAMGVSEKAAETFDTAWTVRNTRKMTGVNKNDDVTVTINGEEVKSEDDVHGLMPFNREGLSKSDRAAFDSLGNFNQSVYSAFDRDFAIASGKEGTESDRKLVDSLIVKEGESYFGKFDPSRALSTRSKLGGASLETLMDQMTSDKTWFSDVHGLKNPAELYKRLTTTGNDWMDKILGYMFAEPSEPFTGKNLLEILSFAASRNQMGRPDSGLFSQWDTPGAEYWGVTPIIRYLMSARLGLAIFQYAVQKSLHTATTLFSNPTDGESELMKGINRLLLHHIFLRRDESGYKLFAQQLNKEIFKKWHHENNKSANEQLKILYTKLLDFTKDSDENKLQTMYSLGWNVRITNILDTIKNYANLIINNNGIKTGEKEDEFINRSEISKLFLKYPNLIGIFLSTGEIGEAFRNMNDGKPTSTIDNTERMKRLAQMFELVNGSDVEQLNVEFESVIRDFSEIVKMSGEKGQGMRDKIKVMLNKVNDSNWEERIRKRIQSGLMSQRQYEELKRKFDELKDKLQSEYMLGDTFDENGNIILTVYEPLSMRQKEEQDSGNTTGQRQY